MNSAVWIILLYHFLCCMSVWYHFKHKSLINVTIYCKSKIYIVDVLCDLKQNCIDIIFMHMDDKNYIENIINKKFNN